MDEIKKERLVSELKKVISEFILHESNRGSLITVTNVTLSKHEKRAYIHVSVYPTSEEEKALAFLTRNTGEAREYLIKHTRMGFPPAIEFVIDEGEKARQKFDEHLSRERSGEEESDTV